MKNKNNDDNKLRVGFDKSKWGVESQESFGGLMGILKTLFKLTDYKIKKDSLSGHKRVKSYSNGIDSVLIFYFPRHSSQPKARIVYKSKNNRQSFFKVISEDLQEDHVTVEVSKNGTSLNIGFPEDINNPTTASTSLDKDNSKVLKKVMIDTKMTNYLLQKLDIILKDLGYKFQNDDPVKSRKPKYGFVTTFKTDWFRIYINHSPVNQRFPFGTIQIDGFKNENKKNSYWVLLFILKILKAYKVPQLEDSYEYPILPSEMEVAFDFHGYQPEFLLELTSSINCRKQTCWWTKKANQRNPYTVEDDKNLLVSASHYVGLREDDDYQVAIYNKPKLAPKFTRLEFRLKNKSLRLYYSKKRKIRRDMGLRDPSVGSVEDLFRKNWIIDFLKRITFARPNDKALLLLTVD